MFPKHGALKNQTLFTQGYKTYSNNTLHLIGMVKLPSLLKIRYYEINKNDEEFLRDMSIVIEESNSLITGSVTYCTPRHIIKKEQFAE